MANIEWTNWSRMKELRVVNPTFGTTVLDDFSWDDSWFGSVGAEYKFTDKLTGRTGVGIETTPVPDRTRGARLPDSDRIWLSFGASYMWSESTTLDFGYSHIFLDDSTIERTLPNASLVGAGVENSANIVSLGFRTKWK
jgi:long-chain fatty acid transport protein